MRKLYIGLLLMVLVLMLGACGKKDDQEEDLKTEDIYGLLAEAENLSGMADQTHAVIRESGSLNWPFEYKGVLISYSSRDQAIIDDLGTVVQPDSCWIESRDQQGHTHALFEHLNDNWPVVVDVILSYRGQTRTAKLLYVVAPQDGFTCDKYKG